MTTKNLSEVLSRAETWPPEDQEALAEYAREIEAQRTGVYVLTADERGAIQEGLDQAQRGEFMSDEEMEKFWKSSGVA
jgi:predicted transcriptional regulator